MFEATPTYNYNSIIITYNSKLCKRLNDVIRATRIEKIDDVSARCTSDLYTAMA